MSWCLQRSVGIAFFAGVAVLQQAGQGAAEITAVPLQDLQSLPSAVELVFDDYVSNPQPGSDPVNLGVVEAFSSPFMGFADPTPDTTTGPLPEAVGVVLESSTGIIEFLDYTSFALTSDVRGPKTGDTLAIRFVDPEDPSVPVEIDGVGLLFGSVAPGVEVSFWDAAGNQLVLEAPSAGEIPADISTAKAWRARDGGMSARAIHKLVFSSSTSDEWLIGSFTAAAANSDMILTGTGCLGDVDGDGDTDIFDFGTLAGNFGNSVPPGTFGDLDEDGVVTVFDFATLALHFGCVP